jgi:hypothetical protein
MKRRGWISEHRDALLITAGSLTAALIIGYWLQKRSTAATQEQLQMINAKLDALSKA